MSASQDAAGGQAAGRGRLAEVIATRGGLAAPEAPFVIEHREALIYMLCEAAELEHGIMCQYLFAAFSLKQSPDEGLSGAELEAAQRWRRQVSHVAAQEMLHLALVHNLLSAVGAAPHFARPNLPAPASHYPAGVELTLLPFGERALRHFMFLERPEGMDLADADGLAAAERSAPAMSERDIVPRGQDFKTVGHLYRSIEAGLDHLVARHGEEWLFVGPPRAQATRDSFGWPELVAVTDLASARRAIEEILEQGEGARGHWQNAHFGQFVAILDEYEQLREASPGFDPVRPVIAANVRQPERDVALPLITDRLTARVTDLFNVAYEILLQIFERYFAHTEETDAQLQVLADATVAVMLRVIKPLGDLITSLPVGDEYPGSNAGPSFELFYESDYLMPHREAAWALLTERLDEAAWLCRELCAGRGAGIADRLDPVLAALREIARTLAAHLPDGSPQKQAAEATELAPGELDQLRRRVREFAAATAARGEAGPGGGVVGLLAAACSEAETAADGPAAEAAVILPRLVNSVLRPLAAALAADQASASRPDDGQPGAGMPAAAGGTGTAGRTATSEPTAGSPAVGRLRDLAETATSLRASLGAAGSCPPELAEATAALQDLACALAAPGESAALRDRLWELQADLPAGVQVATDGPYLVTNVPALIDHLGAERRPAPQLALCRCGASSMQPLCDGSHADSGFSGAKDPNRVTDRRDAYPGQQITIFDNRGICQHSGLCTDRLATVFRTEGEPFVAPSGGRMDEIIRAVRDCPSGALGYAIDGVEARGQVDWGDTRPPAIMVTKDGPYRITGRIPITEADGSATPRAEGASREHYALCRCGHSRNKPFCSGMHWYVSFRDPVPVPGHEPTLFEWAGGLPALTRMTRLLYERHIAADPVLAAVFAASPADQPQRLAAWLAEALGGPVAGVPPADTSDGAGEPAGGATAGQVGAPLAADHVARWVTLARTAADEAGLPADTGFRAALSSCLDWTARSAGARSATATPGRAPRWDWGPGGPPPAEPEPETEQEAAAAPLPGPGEQVSFAAHIKPLFRERDRQSMSFAFDLWSYDGVRARADEILRRLQDGSMPCDGAWPAERIAVFQRWIDGGLQA
jgi:CDGSH-type Zn-finger protein/truncated hemoglobin YjbI